MTLLSRIIERGLVQDGRLIRLRIHLLDKPGALAELTRLIASYRANIVDTLYNRAYYGVNLGDTTIDITMETRGREQVEELLAALVRDLFGTATLERHGATLSFARPFARCDFYQLVKEHAGVDVARAGDEDLRAALKRRHVADGDALSGAKLIDEVFKTFVEPTLIQPTFVCDYPVALSPLAKMKRGDPAKVERWELFIHGREIANAFRVPETSA